MQTDIMLRLLQLSRSEPIINAAINAYNAGWDNMSKEQLFLIIIEAYKDSNNRLIQELIECKSNKPVNMIIKRG